MLLCVLWVSSEAVYILQSVRRPWSHLVLHWADDTPPCWVILRHAPVDGAVARGQAGVGRLQQLPAGMRANSVVSPSCAVLAEEVCKTRATCGC